MKIQIKLALLILVIALFNIGVKEVHASTIITKNIETATTWTKEGSPYVINNSIYVKASLTVAPGVVVKIKPFSSIIIFNSLSAIGSEGEKIVFTSYKDDLFGGDTNGDGGSSSPAPGNWDYINFAVGSSGTMENVGIYYGGNIGGLALLGISSNNVSITYSEIKYAQYIGIYLNNSFPKIEYNTIANNGVGILFARYPQLSEAVVIANNNIVNNNVGARVSGYACLWKKTYADLRNNYWGNASGPYYKATSFYGNLCGLDPDNIFGAGNAVEDGILFTPWLGKDPTVEDPGCHENCYSNVLFLPGIKASRLYKKGLLGTEDKLWIPNFFGDDLEDLKLDENGNSFEDVYTKDVLDEIGIPIIGGNIYKTFLNNLAELKSTQKINDFVSFAYDWRKNVEDVAKNDNAYPENTVKSIIDNVKALAENSKSKKVTIVAHSNGGLVAKAVMIELERLGLAEKVDKIVFVGTPQMGTPLATLSLLYGYDESALFGTLISRSDSRELAENMPGAYGLLPSEKYFQQMENPFVNFSSERTRYEDFRNAYGDGVDDIIEFKSFLLGEGDGRARPEKNEIETENVLNEKLLNQALEIHQRLDAWTPPENVKVIQIAGWGLDTVSGVEYSEKEDVKCLAVDSKVPSCIGMGTYEGIYDPKFTVDGDEVVVAPSALMLPESENVERYWVDLYRSNKFTTIGREHKDILELASVQDFLENIILSSKSLLSGYIFTSRPADYDNAKPRLRMSLYSPLDIHLYDEKGNHTGPKTIIIDGQERIIFEEGIPNSYYYQFGERKYVGFGGGENIRVEMEGYDTGTFTVKLEEVKTALSREEIVAHTAFENLPTIADTIVSFDIPDSGLVDMTALEVDIDGDGTRDYVIPNVPNGTAVPLVTIKTISDNVDLLTKLGYITDLKTQDFLQVKIAELSHTEEMIEKMDIRYNKNPKENQIKLLNKKIEDLVGFVQSKLGETILPLAKNILIENLNSVKI